VFQVIPSSSYRYITYVSHPSVAKTAWKVLGYVRYRKYMLPAVT